MRRGTQIRARLGYYLRAVRGQYPTPKPSWITHKDGWIGGEDMLRALRCDNDLHHHRRGWAGMSMFALIAREIHDADATGYKRIVHIRVTTDALRGSHTSVPVTPERARVIGKLLAVPSRGDWAPPAVTADPMWHERALELLVHPEDWRDLLVEKPMAAGVSALHVGEVTRIYGIPVSR